MGGAPHCREVKFEKQVFQTANLFPAISERRDSALRNHKVCAERERKVITATRNFENHIANNYSSGHFFSLPNAIFSLGLTASELAVYSYLLYCEDRETYQCYPSYKRIGQAISLSQNTIAKCVWALEDKGLITTEPTKISTANGMPRNGTLLYTIRPIQEAVDFRNGQQLAIARNETEMRKHAQRLEKHHGVQQAVQPL